MDNYKIQHIVALAKEGDESSLNQLCSVRPGLHGEIRIKSDHRLKLKQVSPGICEIDMKKGDAVLLY